MRGVVKRMKRGVVHGIQEIDNAGHTTKNESEME